MSTTGNYLNVHDRGNIQQDSAGAFLADHFYKQAEEQRILKLQAQQQEEKFKQAQKILNLMNASQSTTSAVETSNKAVDRGLRNALNPTYAGTKEIKVPNQLMNMLSGQEGVPEFSYEDGAYSNTANIYGNTGSSQNVATPDTMTQELFQTASDRANMPGLSFSNPMQQVQPVQQENNYSLGLDSNFEPTLINNTEKTDALDKELAKLGQDPTVFPTKKTKIKKLAELSAARLNRPIPEGMEVVGERADGTPIYKKIVGMSSSEKRLMNRDMKEITEGESFNEYSLNTIDKALDGIEKVPSGILGKAQVGLADIFDPNSPMFKEWQEIKLVLTDAQLLNTAKTKGAISDQEMKLFAKAAANDDYNQIPKIKVVLADMKEKLASNQKGLVKSFERNYGASPFEGMNNMNAESASDPEYDRYLQLMGQ